jgi:hypothetical protein
MNSEGGLHVAALRLLLCSTLVAALAVICPLRCQVDAVRATAGEVAVESSACPCCPSEPTEAPDPPCPDDCTDCVCKGAVDGPRVAVVELPPGVPGDLPATTADSLALSAGCLVQAIDARPDAPNGATLRLLLASLVI